MNLRRYCRLRSLCARVADRGERVRNGVGLSYGIAYPSGKFESDQSDNFRYCRQILACLRDSDVAGDREQRKNLIAVARHMRLDEIRYRSGNCRGLRPWTGKIFP